MSSPGSLPVLELRIKSMEKTILAMFSEELMKMDVDLQTAVKEFCKPKVIRAIIAEQVAAAIESAIKNEISQYYAYGEGRKVIAAAVVKQLSE